MMGGDSLIRIILLTNVTSITEIKPPVSFRKSFGTTIFPKALRCCLDLEGDCRFEFCPVFVIVDRG